MFNIRKTVRNAEGAVVNSGLVESAAGETKKGDRGRIEEFAQLEADGRYSFNYVDVGNYGKERWKSKVYLTADELDSLIAQLTALRAGGTTSTRVAESTPVVEAPQAASSVAEETAEESAPAAAAEAATDDMDAISA